jgi:hypothetical protein
MFNNLFFENYAVYEIIWKNIVEWGRLQITIWRMRIVCWIHKAINTHTGWIMFIAFPLQQWLHERASFLRYMYIASPVFPETSRPTLRPTQPSVQWVPGIMPV